MDFDEFLHDRFLTKTLKSRRGNILVFGIYYVFKNKH